MSMGARQGSVEASAVARLPLPSGPYGIGTLAYHWVDDDRPEIFTLVRDDRRELMVQVWYPAAVDPSAPREPYVEDARTLVDLARLIGLPDAAFAHVQLVKTHARPGAPVAPDEAQISDDPVLAWPLRVPAAQHGAGRGTGFARLRRGDDRPPVCRLGVIFPDGRLVQFDPRLLPPWPRAVRPGDDPAFAEGVLPYLVRDATFALDQLETVDRADPREILAGRLDLDRRGMFGVSLGGMIAAEACRIDPQFQAGLSMDVFMPDDVVAAGLEQPMMWLSRPKDAMRVEGWDEAQIDDIHASMRSVFEGLPGDGYITLVPDMFHIDFSDGRLLSPQIEARGLCGASTGTERSPSSTPTSWRSSTDTFEVAPPRSSMDGRRRSPGDPGNPPDDEC